MTKDLRKRIYNAIKKPPCDYCKKSDFPPSEKDCRVNECADTFSKQTDAVMAIVLKELEKKI